MKRSLAAGALALLAAGPAAATGDGEGDVAQMLYGALNLILLLVVITYFARKPIRAFFAERRDRIQDELTSAARLRDEAEVRYRDWERRLADIEGELAKIRTTARERAEEERDRILRDANAAAERVRNDARAAVDQELRRSRALLREEASDLAVGLAAELLREQVSDADRDRLVGEFIARIEGA